MIPETLIRFEIELRNAIVAQRFPEVERLVIVYCQTVVCELNNLQPQDDLGVAIATRTQQVLTWANFMLLSNRAEIAAKLAPLPLISRYLAPCGAVDEVLAEA